MVMIVGAWDYNHNSVGSMKNIELTLGRCLDIHSCMVPVSVYRHEGVRDLIDMTFVIQEHVSLLLWSDVFFEE